MKKLINYAQRSVGLLFGLTLLAVSFLFPRNRKIWIFGSNMGFSNNAKFFCLYLSGSKEVRPIWIGDSKEVSDARRMNLEAYKRYSLKGLFYSLIGGVYLFNSYVKDINLFTFGRAVRVNLWHGVGLKNCERKITKGPVANIYASHNPLLKLSYLHFFIKPHYLLSTSQLMSECQSSFFDIPLTNVINNMYPRCEVFNEERPLTKMVESMMDDITRKLIELCSVSAYTYLYMPTWRDSNYNFFGDFDFVKINQILKCRGEYMLLKLHPGSRLEIDITTCDHIIQIDRYADIYEVIRYTDCLITDYSSIYYDYILMRGKRIILYIPDYEHYISEDRDLAFDYKMSTVGEFAYSFMDLADLIENRTIGRFEYEGMDDIVERFWGNTPESSCKDLYEKILDKIGNVL